MERALLQDTSLCVPWAVNTRSILPKIDSLRLLVKDNPFDVFSISETWLKPSISDSEVAIPGYSIVRMDRHGKIGGGTAIYIRDGLPFKTQSDLMNNTLENCMVEILRPLKNCLYVALTEPQTTLLKTTSPNWKTSSTSFQTTASLSCWVTLTLTLARTIDLLSNDY